MQRWLCLTLEKDGVEIGMLTAELWSFGTVGIEHELKAGRSHLRAFFPLDSNAPRLHPAASHAWSELGARVTHHEVVSEQDWMEGYRRRSRPFHLGSGFVVDPREPDGRAVVAGGRQLLRLPARRAFGIGSHESTRLVVRCLEDLEVDGLRVLDVGTGTGVLALVALARGARSVVAVEVDVAAAFMARENQSLNRRSSPLSAGTLECLHPEAVFDLVVMNILPAASECLLPSIAKRLGRGGRAVFSGLSVADEERFLLAVQDAGLRPTQRLAEGDWRALVTLGEAA